VQGPTLVVGEVITFVVSHQIDNRTLGQGRPLVQNESPLLDTCSETAHVPTVRLSDLLGTPSCRSTKPIAPRPYSSGNEERRSSATANYGRVNIPSVYATILPATADAATVSGDARYSFPGPERFW
jgi:hypothetical protein